MTHLLPSSNQDQPNGVSIAETQPPPMGDEELRDLFGAEFCRLEYLIHLLDTGRVKDERAPYSA